MSAQPLYFSAAAQPDQPLFGWLHPAAAARDTGLVVCAPFGFEEECAHKSLRCLAEAAAAQGIPALRFDYAGCGNSAGDEFAPDLHARWLASVTAAIEALKQHAGVDRVVVAGLRLGALLAAQTTAGRKDVCGLVAIAPVLSGKAYLRELKMLGRTGFQPLAQAGDETLLQAAGYALSQPLCEALNPVDLRQLTLAGTVPAPAVLLAERSDVGAPSDWPQALAAQGVAVTTLAFDGYAAMMSDPQNTQVPQALIRAVVGFVQGLSAASASPRPAPAATASASTRWCLPDGVAVEEIAHRLPVADAQLFAISSQPAAVRKTVVLLSSGTLHNIGPGRMWATLARHWAARGVRVIRLDLPGIGETPATDRIGENVVYSADYMPYIAQLLAALRAGQLPGLPAASGGSYHLLGLCSGATHAFKAASLAQGWDSYLLVNPLTFVYGELSGAGQLQSYEVENAMAKYRKALFKAETWKKLFQGRLNFKYIASVVQRKVLQKLGSRRRASAGAEVHGLAADLQSIAAAGGQLRCVFSENAPGEYLLRTEAAAPYASLQASGTIVVASMADADHTFTRAEARRRLLPVFDRLLEA